MSCFPLGRVSKVTLLHLKDSWEAPACAGQSDTFFELE